MASIGETIRRERELRGLSQDALAEGMTNRGFPFHQATIYKIEKGTRSVRVEEAVAFAELLHVNLTDLVHAPDVDEQTAIQIRQAQVELARLDTALYRALDDYNESLRRQNELRNVSPDDGKLQLTPAPVKELEKS